tara:strand:+ start:235 stop:423 length:189 start_codon:yes stop_codon:yes gene_type:complete
VGKGGKVLSHMIKGDFIPIVDKAEATLTLVKKEITMSGFWDLINLLRLISFQTRLNDLCFGK